MTQIENAWRHSVGRRKALLALSGMLAGSPLLKAQLEAPTEGRGPLKHARALGINEMVTPFDFEPVFFGNVALEFFDYVNHASDSEWTRIRNREAFDWVDIVPRPGVDVSAVKLSTELYGVKLENPFFVSPTGQMYGTHPEGTPAMVRGACAAKTLMFMPNQPGIAADPAQSKIAWADTVKAASMPFFWQFYPINDLKASREWLEKAQADGARAIIVTIDQQAAYYPRSVQDDNLGGKPIVRKPAVASAKNPYRHSKARAWYTWKYLDQLREMIKVPMLAKGVLTVEDTELCIQHGLDGVVVSNHGGRALCYSPSTLEVLPEIVAAARGRVPVLLDSGVRRGADAFKAIALGAKAVGMGRVPRWAMGAYGAPGVQRMFEIVQRELAEAMAKAGRSTLASVDQTAVRTNFV